MTFCDVASGKARQNLSLVAEAKKFAPDTITNAIQIHTPSLPCRNLENGVSAGTHDSEGPQLYRQYFQWFCALKPSCIHENVLIWAAPGLRPE